MNTTAYDDFSDDYDRFVNWEERLAFEMPFILETLRGAAPEEKRPTRVLDTACGTGMHVIALAQEGFQTAGIDISENMVARAYANTLEADVRASFKAAGFSQLYETISNSPLYPFDAVLCMGNSLPHLLTRSAVQDALRDMAACLRPGGTLLLQNRNFDAVTAEKQRWLGTQSHREGDNEWLFLRFYDFDADGLITFNIVRLHRIGSAPWTQSISSVRLLPLKQNVLIELLKETGFINAACFGTMGDEPFDADSSGNLVIRAIKS